MNKWISVKEKMPEELLDVLFFVTLKNGDTKEVVMKDIVCGHYEKGKWHICYLMVTLPFANENIEITHWQPLPKPPKDDDE